MDLGLKGRTALVLGASRGLGFASARALAAEGARVIIGAREAKTLEAAAAEIRNEGGTAEPLPVDLADAASLAAMLERIAAEPIDVLVNNGGGPPPGPVSAVSVEQWRASFETMVMSTFRITGAVLPRMRRERFGRIVNIVSSGVVQPIPNLGISNAMRSSIVAWAKTLSDEVAPDGVTVNSVLPGRIRTRRLEELDAATAQRTGQTPEAVAEASLKTIPMRRYGEPGEFANVVAFLASARASYVTGSMIRVDGGSVRGL